MDTTLYNLQGQEAGKITLPALFETRVSPALLHEVITGYLANRRSGTHAAKTRAEVSGGGRKPWREKGTGNARAGSIRSPLWRKGGIIFGPKPRDYGQAMPQQKRRLSLHMALSIKVKEGNLIVVDNVVVSEPKTKKVAEILRNLKVENDKVLLILAAIEPAFKQASRNLPHLIVAEAANINAYQVMWAKKVIFASPALEKLNGTETAKK